MKRRVAALAMAAVMCIGATGCKKKKKPKCENFDLAADGGREVFGDFSSFSYAEADPGGCHEEKRGGDESDLQYAGQLDI